LASLGTSPLLAQAVPRADLPRGGSLRITFDPRISFWDETLNDGMRRPLGWFLGGVTLPAGADPKTPQIRRLEQDIRVAAGNDAFIAILGGARLAVHAERRETPILLEFGVSNRVSVGVRVPLVRVKTSAAFALDTTQANLGRNPRSELANADSTYGAFFGQFDAALAQMQQNILNGTYGPVGSGTRAAAQAFADSAGLVRVALFRAAYGLGTGDAAPFLPIAGSAAGAAIAGNLTRIQQRFATAFGVGGFSDPYLLPTDLMTSGDMSALMLNPDVGFGAAPLADTRRGLRYWLGDVEIGARFGVVSGAHYSLTAGALVRLATGHQDSPHNLLDLEAGDHQVDVEGEVTQAAVIGGRLWLNLGARIGLQQAGARARRVTPADLPLVPRGAAALLSWDPGDYVMLDFAPLYRFTPQFGAGLTVGYYRRGADRYAYRAPQDSLAVSTALGTPTPAGVLDGGTAERRLRLGGAVTFSGPVVEGSFSVERVISARGAAVPAQTVFRLVMRTNVPLF
jgi:hypothetical protein